MWYYFNNILCISPKVPNSVDWLINSESSHMCTGGLKKRLRDKITQTQEMFQNQKKNTEYNAQERLSPQQHLKTTIKDDHEHNFR